MRERRRPKIGQLRQVDHLTHPLHGELYVILGWDSDAWLVKVSNVNSFSYWGDDVVSEDPIISEPE